MVEEGATSEDDSGKNAVAQSNPLETNEPPEKKQKTSATSEYRNRTMNLRNTCRSTVVVNAPQKFAQTVLIERNRQVSCFCEILRFCKQQLEYQLFSFKRCWYPKSLVYIWQICSCNFTLFLLIMNYMMFDIFKVQ